LFGSLPQRKRNGEVEAGATDLILHRGGNCVSAPRAPRDAEGVSVLSELELTYGRGRLAQANGVLGVGRAGAALRIGECEGRDYSAEPGAIHGATREDEDRVELVSNLRGVNPGECRRRWLSPLFLEQLKIVGEEQNDLEVSL
jgi:hypothetical protein